MQVSKEVKSSHPNQLTPWSQPTSFVYLLLYPYLKLVFTIVMRNLLIQTNYLQNKNIYIYFIQNIYIYFIQNIYIYFIQKLAAYFAGALFSSPEFDPLFESRNCWLIFDTVIEGVPEETTSKRQ